MFCKRLTLSSLENIDTKSTNWKAKVFILVDLKWVHLKQKVLMGNFSYFLRLLD